MGLIIGGTQTTPGGPAPERDTREKPVQNRLIEQPQRGRGHPAPMKTTEEETQRNLKSKILIH